MSQLSEDTAIFRDNIKMSDPIYNPVHNHYGVNFIKKLRPTLKVHNELHSIFLKNINLSELLVKSSDGKSLIHKLNVEMDLEQQMRSSMLKYLRDFIKLHLVAKNLKLNRTYKWLDDMDYYYTLGNNRNVESDLWSLYTWAVTNTFTKHDEKANSVLQILDVLRDRYKSKK